VFARCNKTTNLRRAVTLDLSVEEALAVARFLGALKTDDARAFGFFTHESQHPYETLADALEYGPNPLLPIEGETFRKSELYDRLQKLPRVEVSEHEPLYA